LISQSTLCIFLLKLHKKAWIYQLSFYSLNLLANQNTALCIVNNVSFCTIHRKIGIKIRRLDIFMFAFFVYPFSLQQQTSHV
ncbi:hypothetical protein, partial [Anaerostipes hadrus]|uniref:hypothetical protein n=1 Tax=Anaerostipes hadrus TaxID=649756 RepID=UPI001ADD8465